LLRAPPTGRESFHMPIVRAVFLLATLALTICVAGEPAVAAPKEVRIGVMKTGLLFVARQLGALEKRFAAQGITVRWSEFTYGPPTLEALSAGSVDFAYTGDTPPIFAQAAGANIVYVAAQAGTGSYSAILLPKGSTIRTLSDLKGKRVAIAKASSAHNLIIAALEKVGLTFADITPIYLPPADARAAFERGNVDAWAIWDPFYAVAEQGEGVRVLAAAESITPQNAFFLANRDFIRKSPEIIATINAVLGEVSAWIDDHREETADLMAKATGVDLAIQRISVNRSKFIIGPTTDAVIAEQQETADRFYRLKLIPDPIAVRDIVWPWTANAAAAQ
jgi:sulfonate transport system substrate-binding protein